MAELLPSGIKILQWNINGLKFTSKKELIELCQNHNVDVILLQETHVSNRNDNLEAIPNYILINRYYHRHHGIATYVHEKIENHTKFVEKASDEGKWYFITIQVRDAVHIVNVYKSPNEEWPQSILPKYPDSILPVYSHPTIYVGDFNCRHVDWNDNTIKREVDKRGGVQLVKWSEKNNLSLIFDFFQPTTLPKNQHSPDVCFVTRDERRKPLCIKRKVLTPFKRKDKNNTPEKRPVEKEPPSDHEPVLYDTNIDVPMWLTINSVEFTKTIENWIMCIRSIDYKNFSQTLFKPKDSSRSQIMVHDLKELTLLKRNKWKSLVDGRTFNLTDLWNFYNDLPTKALLNIERNEKTMAVDDCIAAMEIDYDDKNYYGLYFKNSGLKFREWLTDFYDDIISNPTNLNWLQGNEPISKILLQLFQNLLYNKISGILLNHLPFHQLANNEQLLLLDTYIKGNFMQTNIVSVVAISISECKVQESFKKLLQFYVRDKKMLDIFSKACKNYDTKKIATLGLKLHFPDIKNQLKGSRIYVIKNELLFCIHHKRTSVEAANNKLAEYCRNLNEYCQRHGIAIVRFDQFSFYLGRWFTTVPLNNIKIAGVELSFPEYLTFGNCTFDRGLQYTQHIKNKILKLNTIKNLIHLISETDWGDNGEYLLKIFVEFVMVKMLACSPLWIKTKSYETAENVINDIMRVIAGVLNESKSYFLPVILNIPSPEQIMMQTLKLTYDRIVELKKTDLEIKNQINQDFSNYAVRRELKSITSWLCFAKTMKAKTSAEYLQDNLKTMFRFNKQYEVNLEQQINGLSLNRSTWISLNRIRSKLGIVDLKKNCDLCKCVKNGSILLHVVENCPDFKYIGSLNDFLTATDEAIEWINNLEIEI